MNFEFDEGWREEHNEEIKSKELIKAKASRKFEESILNKEGKQLEEEDKALFGFSLLWSFEFGVKNQPNKTTQTQVIAVGEEKAVKVTPFSWNNRQNDPNERLKSNLVMGTSFFFQPNKPSKESYHQK